MDNEKEVRGIVLKAASVQAQDVTDAELKKINKYTLSPLGADEVFTFKTIACDNELDDRNFEPFNLQALKDLKKLYPGKTVIKDHRRTADNQIARVYDAELVQDETKQTGAGEPHTDLVLKCYMIKTTTNADLISDIKAGIKKEVSTGTVPKKMICSICGVDNTKTYCAHYWGREYDTADGGKKQCYFTLDGAKEAYEMSFVAVPAQPRAGTRKCKSYMEDEPEQVKQQKPAQEPPAEPTPEQESKETVNKDSEAAARARFNESFFYAQNTEGDL